MAEPQKRPLVIPLGLPDWTELMRRVNVVTTWLMEWAEDVDDHVEDTSIHFEDAPQDGQRYVRRDGNWEVLP